MIIMGWREKMRRFRQGLYVTLCAICNIRVEQFEQQRFVLLKHVNNHEIESPPSVGELSEMSTGNTECQQTQKGKVNLLIVSFAGSNLVVGGFPRAEFKRSLILACQQSGIQADLLFLTDPSQTFKALKEIGMVDSTMPTDFKKSRNIISVLWPSGQVWVRPGLCTWLADSTVTMQSSSIL
eukprot:m.121358 g.121358  ORF g.121358 m.121358 type:complete len:181 (+) comp28847_c0_seq1:136-678(+)